MENEQSLGWATAWVIREAREAAGLTQGQLAGFSGLSDSYIAPGGAGSHGRFHCLIGANDLGAEGQRVGVDAQH